MLSDVAEHANAMAAEDQAAAAAACAAAAAAAAAAGAAAAQAAGRSPTNGNGSPEDMTHNHHEMMEGDEMPGMEKDRPEMETSPYNELEERHRLMAERSEMETRRYEEMVEEQRQQMERAEFEARRYEEMEEQRRRMTSSSSPRYEDGGEGGDDEEMDRPEMDGRLEEGSNHAMDEGRDPRHEMTEEEAAAM